MLVKRYPPVVKITNPELDRSLSRIQELCASIKHYYEDSSMPSSMMLLDEKIDSLISEAHRLRDFKVSSDF